VQALLPCCQWRFLTVCTSQRTLCRLLSATGAVAAVGSRASDPTRQHRLGRKDRVTVTGVSWIGLAYGSRGSS
jgi:hypothetical protein